MTRQYEEDEFGNPRMDTDMERRNGSGGSLLAGLMIGGLIGAASMLLFAPQSGRETRDAVASGANDLKDRATDTAQRTVSQARSKAQELAANAKDKASDLQNRGMNMAADQLDKVSKVAQSGKRAVQASKNDQSNTNSPSSY